MKLVRIIYTSIFLFSRMEIREQLDDSLDPFLALLSTGSVFAAVLVSVIVKRTSVFLMLLVTKGGSSSLWCAGCIFCFRSNDARTVGVHLVLFCTCAYILYTRGNPAQLVLLLSAITMFALATADISLSFRLIIDDVPAVQRGNIGVDVILAHIFPKIPIFVTNK
jgi:hypothetical protein